MKKLFLLLAMVGLAFASCTPGGEDGPGGNGGAGGSNEFTFEVTNIGEQGATVTVTPKDEARTYYWQVTAKSNLFSNFESTAAYMQYVYEYLKQSVENEKGTWEAGKKSLLFTGVNSYSFESLDPDTTYLAYAFGVDVNGNLTSSDLSYYEFKTLPSTFDSSVWAGVWNITSPSVFVQTTVEGKYQQAFTEVEGGFTRPVEIVDGETVDPSLAGQCAIYGWDGFFVYDAPAVGMYVGNTIQLINNEIVYEDPEQGAIYQWIAMSAVTEMGYDSDVPVGGEYPPYTFVMDKDGNVQIEAYVGELTNGMIFNVLNFNIFPVVGEDIYVWNYEEPAYTFSGDVMTAVKVPAEDNGGATPAPAKLSAKKNFKIMHKMANQKFVTKKFTAARFVK
ncbi:MAG: hypothetical protein E7129_03020 [Rikenellaceae bacterium]|nr:hypothetical protein [Rikenellaceae bacterium]